MDYRQEVGSYTARRIQNETKDNKHEITSF